MSPNPALGIDVSGWQTSDQVRTASLSGKYGWCVVKATEGKGARSSAYPVQSALVKGAALLAGAYHFAWPNQDPVLEVGNFLEYAQPQPLDVVALDLEEWGETDPTKPNYARDKAMRDGTPWTQRVEYALAWLREAKAATGATPLVYMNWSWIKAFRTASTLEQWAELTSYPLWLAEPSGTPGKHSTVTAKDGSSEDSWPIAAHQWTNNDGGLDGDFWTGRVEWEAVCVPREKVA